jgi:hypothetical protein
MTEPLAVGQGARVTFPDVLLMDLVKEQVALPPFLVQGGEHRRMVPESLTSMDRYSPLRERMISLRGSRLLLLAILVAPLVMAGYVGLAVLVFLPLLLLRRIFRRPSMPAVVRCDGDPRRYSGVGNLWDAATGRA